jgi:hypothetical protein
MQPGLRELSPTDRVSLYHGRLIARYERILKQIWMRSLAMGLIRRGGRRFNELADEIREISNKECRRIFDARRVASKLVFNPSADGRHFERR